jgi:hypothetical protein
MPCSQMTGRPEVIGSPVGLVSESTLVLTNPIIIFAGPRGCHAFEGSFDDANSFFEGRALFKRDK